jgi:outer membrane protein TolC
VLSAFQQEDNLAAVRILEQEARIQGEAVAAVQQALAIVIDQYKAGIANYLSMVVAQAIALNNERTAVDILGRRMNAVVLLVKDLGGGWDASTLGDAEELAENPDKP